MIAPPLALPGLGWLPRPLRDPALAEVVIRFLWLGPLIGGLPYNLFLLPIPFSLLIGAVPAAIAGLLFGAWWLAPQRRAPTWPWRMAVGALCGGLGCAVFARLIGGDHAHLLVRDAGVLALHGVPAGAVLGLLQKPRATCP